MHQREELMHWDTWNKLPIMSTYNHKNNIEFFINSNLIDNSNNFINPLNDDVIHKS